MRFFVFIFGILLPFVLNAQISTPTKDTAKKEKPWKVFGMIYGGLFTNITENYASPKTAFEVKSAILGYKNQFAENVDATIMLDVSKTTRDIKLKYDTTSVSFTEGNNYTFYLKQAEIQWKINTFLELSLGQLLSSQYLLTQDKWWDHRYIYYTFQEVCKYGAPADFGARLKWIPVKNIAVSASVLNGDGPSRWQDNNSKFQYCGDVEYRLKDSLVFKLYADYREPLTSGNNVKPQSVFNFFAGYIVGQFRFGAGASYIYRADYMNKDASGASGYIIYKFLKKFEAFSRYDYFKDIKTFSENHFLLTGLQYEPAKNFFLSVNYRELWPEKTAQIFLNFGAKF